MASLFPLTPYPALRSHSCVALSSVTAKALLWYHTTDNLSIFNGAELMHNLNGIHARFPRNPCTKSAVCMHSGDGICSNSLIDVAHQILPKKFDLKHKNLCFTSLCADKAKKVFGGHLHRIGETDGSSEKNKTQRYDKKTEPDNIARPHPVSCD